MPKLIISVDAVGQRAVAGPVTGAAVLFDAETREPRFQVEDTRRKTTVHYDLREPKKIPALLLPHVVAHIKKIAISFASVHQGAERISNGREAAWTTMGQAAARAAERAKHIHSSAIQVGTDAIEIHIPPGGHCPYALVGRIGQRPVPVDWRRGAAFLLARAAHIDAMMQLHEQYPEYEFDKNHGNLSNAPRRALRRFGRTPDHRGVA